MKTKRIGQAIIMAAIGVTLVISILAFSFAWHRTTFSKPYTFDILADGVLYVYMDADVVHSSDALFPAVAMPGAIAEGLPYNVLKTHEQDSASYISKAASVTGIEGACKIYNEGYGYIDKELEHDPVTGATLYPKLVLIPELVGYNYDVGPGQDPIPIYAYHWEIDWIDDSDHSKGWNTCVMHTKYVEVSETDEQTHKPIKWRLVNRDGSIQNSNYDPSNYNAADYLYTGVDYAPELDDEDNIVFTGGSPTLVYIPDDDSTGNYENVEEYAYSGAIYKHEQIVKPGSNYAVVNFELRFKASDNPDIEDYYDTNNFVVNKILFVEKGDDEFLPDSLKTGVGNRVRQYVELADNKKTGSFHLYGSESFFVYAEVYLAQPDELLDPRIRDAKYIYMTVHVSVEVEQFQG